MLLHRCIVAFFLFETATVPVHVETNPPMTQAAELEVITVLIKGNEIVDQLKKTPEVMRLICALQENINDYQKAVYQDELKEQFQAALYQGGISSEIARAFSLMQAYNVVKDIEIVLVKHGDSIVVHFLCKTVKALYELGQMIVSGFMHAVFAAAIESLARTSVNVNVRADEFNLKLLNLSSQQEKGNSVDR